MRFYDHVNAVFGSPVFKRHTTLDTAIIRAETNGVWGGVVVLLGGIAGAACDDGPDPVLIQGSSGHIPIDPSVDVFRGKDLLPPVVVDVCGGVESTEHPELVNQAFAVQSRGPVDLYLVPIASFRDHHSIGDVVHVFPRVGYRSLNVDMDGRGVEDVSTHVLLYAVFCSLTTPNIVEQGAVGIENGVEVPIEIGVYIVEWLCVSLLERPGFGWIARGVFPTEIGPSIVFIIPALEVHAAARAVARSRVVPRQCDLADPNRIFREVLNDRAIGVGKYAVDIREELLLLGIGLHHEVRCDVGAHGERVVLEVAVAPEHGAPSFGDPENGCGDHDRIASSEFELAVRIVHLTDFDVHVNGVVHDVRTVLEQEGLL